MSCRIELHVYSNVRVFPLKDPQVTFGRDERCTFVFNQPTISRIHFTIRRVSESPLCHWLFDGEYINHNPSRNGVYVNRLRVNSGTMLRHGDRIGFGGFWAKYLCDRVSFDKGTLVK